MKGAKSLSRSSKESKISVSKSDLLKGLSVCVSGFSNFENQELKRKIEKLGGKYLEDLLASTHYLIINKINSSKAICAMKNNIKLVTKEWLNEDDKEKFLQFENCKPGCFYGINLFLFGFNEDEFDNMNKTINQKGGYLTNNISDSDIIIIKSNSGYIDEEIEKFKKYNHKLVTENWFNSCLEKNEFKNIEENKNLLNIELINQNYTNIISDIESGHNDKYINLFRGKIFAIQGFKSDIKKKIIQLISFCNGFIFFESVMENTDYVIVPLTFDNSHLIQSKLNTFGQSPKIVTCNWLFDCIKKGEIINPDLYKPMKSIDIPKETITSKKVFISGNLFKGQTFSIVNITYSKEKILEIKEKIEENMGEYVDSGHTVNAADFGVANGTEMGTQTLSDGTKLVFDGGGNSNAPKYYNSGTNIRMYPKNTVTITASKNISKVVFNVDEYQGTICNASGDISASPGTIALDGKVVTISGISDKSTVITNTSSGTGAASQIRVISIEITYARYSGI